MIMHIKVSNKITNMERNFLMFFINFFRYEGLFSWNGFYLAFNSKWVGCMNILEHVIFEHAQFVIPDSHLESVR